MVYIKYQKKHILTHFNYTSIALLTMGIIDIFHGLVMPGELFVWLHSSAVFLGGVFFISIWLNERKVTEETYQLIPIAIVGFAICFSLLSIVFYDNLPLMIDEDKS